MEFFLKTLLVILFVVGVVMLLKEVGKWNPPVSSCDVNGKPHKHGAGVGGWLLFLIFTLVVTGPLLNIGSVLMTIINTEGKTPDLENFSFWTGSKAMLWFFTAASVILSIYAGIELLLKRTKTTVRKVIMLLWISGPGIGLVAVIVLWVYLYANSPEETLGSINLISSFGDILKSAMGAAGWTLYLRMSKRVRNTYGY